MRCVFIFTLLTWAFLFALFKYHAVDKRYLEINAEAESLSFRVVRPEFAAFPVVGAVVRNQSQCDTVLGGFEAQDFIGLVRPHVGTTVTYRYTLDRVSVRLKAERKPETGSGGSYAEVGLSAGDLIMSGVSCPLTDTAVVVYPLTDDNARPLPIAGPLEIGTAFGPPLAPERGKRAIEGFMYGADVYVFGRSILSDRLFPLYDSPISIPAGGTLSSVEFDTALGLHEQSSVENTDWYGIAELGSRAFLVSATVQTTDLVFTRAGSSGEKETIAVSFFTEVVRDPDLSVLLLWVGLFFFLFQMVETIFSMSSKRK